LNLGYALAYLLLSNIYCCYVNNWDFNGDVKQHKEDKRGVKKIMVGHGMNGMMRCIHLYYMIKTILKQKRYVDNNVTLGR
jgi:hypothetical protein